MTYISIEGNISAGKSTLLTYLEKEKKFQIIKEPLNIWENFKGYNLLRLSYENKAQYSFLFQNLVQLSMLKQHLSHKNRQMVIQERSYLSTHQIFCQKFKQDKTFSYLETEILNEYFTFFAGQFEQQISPKKIIYLQTKPEVSFERIKYRNRGGENFISLEYVKSIHNLYENWITKIKKEGNIKVLTVDANQDKARIHNEYNKIIHFIEA